METMKWFSLVLFFVLVFFGYCALQPISDAKLQCRKYHFDLNFNITAERNVVVVYNSALCKRCLQKLFLFKALQHRFEIADFKDLIFIMLTTELNGSAQFADLKNKTGNVTLISLQDINNDIFVPGSIYVFDKCSRLSYELVPPLSEIQNQMVKAAVLSTWYDSICGNCEFELDESKYFEDNYYFDEDQQSTTTEGNAFNFENTEIVDPNNIVNEDDDDIIVRDDDVNFIVPLKIIIPIKHIHKDDVNNNNTFIKYNYLVLNSNDSTEHEHLSKDNSEILFQVPTKNHTEFIDSLNVTKYFTVKKIYSNTNLSHTSNSHLRIDEIAPVSNAVAINPPANKLVEKTSKQFDTSALLSTLHPWLSFRLVNRSSEK